MQTKKILLTVFALVVIAQLFVPAKMIFDREQILKEGKVMKFRTAPVDPYDPFRGKYITLNFKDDFVMVEDRKEWSYNEKVYAILEADSVGFARVSILEKEIPDGDYVYLETMIDYVDYNEDKVWLDFPFNRYYMEESKAFEAELSYRDSQRDSLSITWAEVSILDGQAVLKDVMIDGVRIEEVVKKVFSE